MEELAKIDRLGRCHVRGLTRDVTRAELSLSQYGFRGHPRLQLYPALALESSPAVLAVMQRDPLLSREDARAVAAVASAVQGATALFLVTFSDFERLGAEARVGMHMARAALDAGVQHIALSGGMRTGKVALDAKADLEDAIRTLPFAAAHFVHTGFFYENLVLKGGAPRLTCKSGGSGGVALAFYSPFPEDWPVVMHAASDIGRTAVRRLWQGGAPVKGGQDVVRLAGSKLTGEAYADAVARLGRRRGWHVDAGYSTVPASVLKKALPGIGKGCVGGLERSMITALYATPTLKIPLQA